MPIDWYEYYRQNIIEVNEFVDRHIYSNCSDIISMINDCEQGDLDDWYVVFREDTDEDGNVINVVQDSVLQHWFVSDWLANKLLEKGEKVEDIGKHRVWCRTSCNLAITQEFNILEIHKENEEVWKL